MDEFLIVGTTQLDTPIYVSELSKQTLADNDLGSDTTGLYVYEADEHPNSLGIRVLALIPNQDAAYRLMDLMGVQIEA